MFLSNVQINFCRLSVIKSPVLGEFVSIDGSTNKLTSPGSLSAGIPGKSDSFINVT